MRLIPMHFGLVNVASEELYGCNAFALPPPARSIHLPQTGYFAYSFANRDGFDLRDLANNGEVH